MISAALAVASVTFGGKSLIDIYKEIKENREAGERIRNSPMGILADAYSKN